MDCHASAMCIYLMQEKHVSHQEIVCTRLHSLQSNLRAAV